MKGKNPGISGTMLPPAAAGAAGCADYFDLIISRRCTNRCVFCYAPSGAGERPLGLREIVGTLMSEYRRGVKRVHLMGGEASLHGRFEEIVRFARKIGFYVVVVSNGGRFSDREFCGRVAPFIDEAIFSLHGDNAELHGTLTGNSGSFGPLMRAIGNMSSVGCRVGINTVVMSANLGRLKAIAGLIRPYGVTRYLCMNPVPAGRGGKSFFSIVPRLGECRAVFPGLIRKCLRDRLRISFAGFPLCVIPGYPECSQDATGEYAAGKVTRKAGGVVFEKPPGAPKNFKLDWGRVQSAACSGCGARGACGGCSAVYLRRFGSSELKAF